MAGLTRELESINMEIEKNVCIVITIYVWISFYYSIKYNNINDYVNPIHTCMLINLMMPFLNICLIIESWLVPGEAALTAVRALS